MKNKSILFYKTKQQVITNPLLLITALLMLCIGVASCTKDFDVKVGDNTPKLVVEAYINNEMRAYNYVILTRSLSYSSLDFESTPVSDATVTITEGERTSDGYIWDTANKVQLQSLALLGVPAELTSIYFDPRLITDSANALLGKPGKSYLLEISEGNNQYSSITTLLPPVQIDSLTTGYGFVDEDDSTYKLRITNNYQDPDTLGNRQLFFYRFSENRNRFGWGSLYGNRNNSTGTDELTNGEYIRLTQPRGFVLGDTVEYRMASVTSDVYNFWESFNNARNNGGPFATPVTLVSNISGSNVIGCFSGMSLSSKTIIIKE